MKAKPGKIHRIGAALLRRNTTMKAKVINHSTTAMAAAPPAMSCHPVKIEKAERSIKKSKRRIRLRALLLPEEDRPLGGFAMSGAFAIASSLS
jgi:hypothetical protein